MLDPSSRTPIRRLLAAFVLPALLAAGAASAAQPYAVGDEIAPFTLEDQHGKTKVKGVLSWRPPIKPAPPRL